VGGTYFVHYLTKKKRRKRKKKKGKKKNRVKNITTLMKSEQKVCVQGGWSDVFKKRLSDTVPHIGRGS